MSLTLGRVVEEVSGLSAETSGNPFTHARALALASSPSTYSIVMRGLRSTSNTPDMDVAMPSISMARYMPGDLTESVLKQKRCTPATCIGKAAVLSETIQNKYGLQRNYYEVTEVLRQPIGG